MEEEMVSNCYGKVFENFYLIHLEDDMNVIDVNMVLFVLLWMDVRTAIRLMMFDKPIVFVLLHLSCFVS